MKNAVNALNPQQKLQFGQISGNIRLWRKGLFSF
jgi:hypothetical protein